MLTQAFFEMTRHLLITFCIHSARLRQRFGNTSGSTGSVRHRFGIHSGSIRDDTQTPKRCRMYAEAFQKASRSPRMVAEYFQNIPNPCRSLAEQNIRHRNFKTFKISTPNLLPCRSVAEALPNDAEGLPKGCRMMQNGCRRLAES